MGRAGGKRASGKINSTTMGGGEATEDVTTLITAKAQGTTEKNLQF